MGIQPWQITEKIRSNRIVENNQRFGALQSQSSFHPDDTIVPLSKAIKLAGNHRCYDGTCSMESEEQVVSIAKSVSNPEYFSAGRGLQAANLTLCVSGTGIRRTGIVKDRQKRNRTANCQRLMSLEHLEAFENGDIIQVGQKYANLDLLQRWRKVNSQSCSSGACHRR